MRIKATDIIPGDRLVMLNGTKRTVAAVRVDSTHVVVDYKAKGHGCVLSLDHEVEVVR